MKEFSQEYKKSSIDSPGLYTLGEKNSICVSVKYPKTKVRIAKSDWPITEVKTGTEISEAVGWRLLSLGYGFVLLMKTAKGRIVNKSIIKNCGSLKFELRM
mmetsp:Transcript_9299/g.13838  ORF Transcript_9299/g.13838 Transcript_9299/m.13838 type:complete len:101 (-) Transcript_9299:907-1209(-)